jgi:hypothetical protein
VKEAFRIGASGFVAKASRKDGCKSHTGSTSMAEDNIHNRRGSPNIPERAETKADSKSSIPRVTIIFPVVVGVPYYGGYYGQALYKP